MTSGVSAFKAAAFAVVAVVLATVAVVGLTGQAKSDLVHLTLIQSKPDFHSNAANAVKPHDGDDATFYAGLSEHGKPVGHIALVKFQVHNPADPGTGDPLAKHALVRLSLITFSLGGNDTLEAQGLTHDRADGMTTGEPEVRAITGGTGKYEFATGQVTSTREADGTYRHEIDVRLPNGSR